MHLRTLLVLSTLLLAATSDAEDAPTPNPTSRRRVLSVAVLDLAALDAPAELAQNLTALIAAEIGRYDEVRTVTRREIASLLDLERQRQLLGCSDEGCIGQIAGALGVAKIVSGQIGRVEHAYILTLQLLDARTGKVDARLARTIPQGEGLVNATKAAVTDLIGDRVSSKNQGPRLAVPQKLLAHEEDVVHLDATRSYDPDGDPLRFRWRQVDGPPALLETPEQARAQFVPAEVGLYSFDVEVGDGRSAPQRQQVQVEVRRRKRFSLAAGFQTLLSFNRVAVPRGEATEVYRNRSLMGGALTLDLRFSEEWALIAELGGNTMSVTPEGSPDDTQDRLDVTSYTVMVGVRRSFVFSGFQLFLAASIGTGRRYYSASYHNDAQPSSPYRLNEARSEAIMGDVSAGVAIPVPELWGVPFDEYVGLFAQGGIRAMKGTDIVGPFPAEIPINVPGNGFQWGANATVGVYVRL